MFIKTRIPKSGKLETYINIPIVDRSFEYGCMNNNQKCIGHITNAEEIDGEYELTIMLYNKFVNLYVEKINGKPSAISINF